MNRYNWLAALLLLTATGCAAKRASSEDKMELSLHKVRTELEDIKHDLNTYEIEHHVLEGKVVEQAGTLVSLRQSAIETQANRLEKLSDELASLEKRLSQLAKQQEKMIADVRQLTTHANDTTTALSQYKEKIAEVEKVLAAIGQSKNHIYSIKQNDSLEQISKHFGLSVDDLKKANDLDSELIHPGQQLLIPTGGI